jgi:thioredoxin reductase (NADPH)
MSLQDKVHNVIIIGSGPAGWTAALYAGRANLNPLVFEGASPNTPGGQLMITSEVENYPGFPEGILGPELMDRFKAQAVRFNVDVLPENVAKVDFSKKPFKVWSEDDVEYQAHSVIISTGATAKLLHLENEAHLMGTGAGVSACATCDGAFYRDVDVAVVGGGDTAMEEALFLTRFASSVTIIHRREGFRASKIMEERAKDHPKIKWELNQVVDKLLTEERPPLNKEMLSGLTLKNTQTGETKDIAVEGFFIAIGHKPNTEIFADWLDLDENGYLVTKAKSTATNIEGVYACGDVQDVVYRQAITAAGTGCMAAIEAERFLEEEGF